MREGAKHIIYELASEGFDFEVLGGESKFANSVIELHSQISRNLSGVPWVDLAKKAWIKGEKGVPALAPLASSFFDDSVGRALFRKCENVNDTLISFWLSRIETRAKLTFLDNPNMEFENCKFTREEMVYLVKQSVKPEFIRDIPNFLARFGIILIYEQGIPSLKADGVVMKLQNGIPVIGMSLRYSRLDNFWFTLMHELSHVVLHYGEMNAPIVEDFESGEGDALEIAANRFAQNALVPRSIWNRCPPKYELTDDSIKKFAKQQGIHPAIVAGMLQRETNKYGWFRAIVDAVNVVDIIEGKA